MEDDGVDEVVGLDLVNRGLGVFAEMRRNNGNFQVFKFYLVIF